MNVVFSHDQVDTVSCLIGLLSWKSVVSPTSFLLSFRPLGVGPLASSLFLKLARPTPSLSLLSLECLSPEHELLPYFLSLFTEISFLSETFPDHSTKMPDLSLPWYLLPSFLCFTFVPLSIYHYWTYSTYDLSCVVFCGSFSIVWAPWGQVFLLFGSFLNLDCLRAAWHV